MPRVSHLVVMLLTLSLLAGGCRRKETTGASSTGGPASADRAIPSPSRGSSASP